MNIQTPTSAERARFLAVCVIANNITAAAHAFAASYQQRQRYLLKIQQWVLSHDGVVRCEIERSDDEQTLMIACQATIKEPMDICSRPFTAFDRGIRTFQQAKELLGY